MIGNVKNIITNFCIFIYDLLFFDYLEFMNNLACQARLYEIIHSKILTQKIST